MPEETQNASDGAPDKTPSTNIRGEYGTSNKELETEEEDASDSSSSVERETPSEKERRAEKEASEGIVYYEQALKKKMQWDSTCEYSIPILSYRRLDLISHLDHPGVNESDLVQYTDGFRVVSQDWFNENDSNIASIFHCQPETELCHNCGWTSNHQISPFPYTSRVKVSYLKEHMALWEVGPKWFIRDEINNDWNSPANDYNAQELIRKNLPEVPLVEMYRFGDKDDKYALTVMSRAKGIELSAIVNQLTAKQKEMVIEDLAIYVQKWRKLTSPRMQTADGKPLRDFIFRCDEGPCLDVPFDPIEWLKKLAPAWRKTLFSLKYKYSRRADRPKGRFPESWIREVDEKVAKIKTVLLGEGRLSNEDQYVFTHGDLNKGNIFIVEEKPVIFKISAIIDWEFAGYCPWCT